MYYVLRAIIIIYPWWDKDTFTENVVSIIQTVISFVVIVIVVQSYKFDLSAIKYALYLQSFIFILSNINMYKRDRTINFQGLNILNACFSMIFTVINVVYATMINMN